MILANVALSICFLTALLGLLSIKSANKSIKFFTFLLISHFVLQFFAIQIYLIMGANGWFYKSVRFVYILFEYLFFLNLLAEIKYRRVILIIFGVGSLAVIIHYLDSFSNPINVLTSTLLNNILILLSSFVYYIYMMKNISLQPLFRNWEFIIVTGFFIYALGSTGANITTLYALDVGLATPSMVLINCILYIIELCIFFWGLWVYRAELKSNQKLKEKDYVVE